MVSVLHLIKIDTGAEKMCEYQEFQDIYEYPTWDVIRKVDKGWSEDKKYYIKDSSGNEFLLRISDISNLESKKKEYENLCKIYKTGINMSAPISFGVCSNKKYVYSLLTWINGNDAETVLPNLSTGEQYELGVESGEILMSIHTIQAPLDQQKWSDRYNSKIDRKIKSYNDCGITIPHADKIIKYINDNRYLLEDREQTIEHGDYHAGNLIITEDNKVGVIDFNRYGFGDPWEEFNRIGFSLNASIPFTIGQINGYFNNNVPDKFFKLMALYMATNSLSSVPWAIPFGQTQVNVMLRNIDKMLDFYHCFDTYIPVWYKF
jgi:Predicted aminoglycoside phosphotransferase